MLVHLLSNLPPARGLRPEPILPAGVQLEGAADSEWDKREPLARPDYLVPCRLEAHFAILC